MAPTPLQQRRTHNNLLFQKLLNLRDGASPFTLVLDTLEQSGKPLLREFVNRAKISRTKIIYISYTTLRRKIPFEVDVFISARSKTLSALRTEIVSHLPPPGPPTSQSLNGTKYLLILPLNVLATRHPHHLTPFLSSLLFTPQISLLGTYHIDIPITSSSSSSGIYSNKSNNPYQPHPLTTLTHLSTAILTVSSLAHVLAAKRARDKSLQEPVFGLAERREGILFGLRSTTTTTKGRRSGVDVDGGGRGEGIVVQMELRRKSGRGVVENFVLLIPASSSTTSSSSSSSSSSSTTSSSLSQVILLDEHPLYAPDVASLETGQGGGREEGMEEGTFSLQLTEKQRRDREGVVLPYFDAQKGGGEGGRILYEMSEVDREDFDEEEDEI